MVKVGIIGATGYAGAELIRILMGHPGVELHALGSSSQAGKAVSEIYPNFFGINNMVLLQPEQVIASCGVIFTSLPHGLSEGYAKQCKEQGKILIDLGADFRLTDEGVYEKWYAKKFDCPELHPDAVYGLPELNREKIKGAKLIGNPGCYPTSISLALYPALKAGLLKLDTIVADSKSGVTGAGRGLTQNTHFPDCNESFAPYKAGAHRHTPEIEQTLSQMAGEKVEITFVPHLLPLNRGIISTIYAKKDKKLSLLEIHQLYREFYQGEPFVRVLPLGSYANLKNVRMSNFCDISLHEDEHTGRLILVGTLDNMVKGAAGQAVQNMNLILGLPETTGLMSPPPAF